MRTHAPRSRLRVLLLAVVLLAVVPAGAGAAPKKVKIGFGSSSYTVVEGNTFSVIVTRTGNTRAAASVEYTTQNGTAAAPGDFTAQTGTLNFAAGETRKTISIPTVDNGVAGAASKTFTVKLSNGQPDSIPPGKATATLRILDNDGPGTIDFSSTTYSVVEGAGVATITVNRAAASNLVESVDYTTTELAAGAGHATASDDYTTTTGTLTFNAGELSKSFQVPIADDSDFEGDETLHVTLSNPQNITNPLDSPELGTNNPATLTIVDDDVSTFTFSSPTYSVGEEDGTRTITVTRSGATNVAADIGFSDDGSGTATADTDYSLTAGSLHFNAGQTSNTFDVTILSDNDVEGNETVGLHLTEGSDEVDTALLSIVDDDASPTPSVQFSNTDYDVDEADATATLTVTLSEPAIGGETVHYATGNPGDSATEGVGGDYVGQSDDLTFTAGQSSQTITIALSDDNEIEDPERFTVALSSPSGLVLGDPGSAYVNIADDDGTGTLEFTALSYHAGEVDGHATITVRRVGGSGGTASVDYATSDGTAHAPGDYAATSGTLNFAEGETTKTFDVPVVWDGEADGDETVSLSLTNFVSDDAPDTTKAAVLHIADDGASGPVQFSAASYDVAETAGNATITVTHSGGLGGPVTVDYAGTDGTHGTLTFAAGDGSKTFQVPVVDDNVHTGTRTVNLSLSNPGGGTSLGSPATATLNIADNEPATSASTDKTAPKLKLTAKKLQKALKARKLVLKVRSSEAAKLTITANLLKGKKLVRVATGSKRVAAGKTVTIKLKLSKKALAKLSKALVKGKAKIRVAVTGTDAAGNKATVRRTITIR